ncbi:MAG: acetylglutamate kinase [Dysgonamonadaceae bacterium]|jgi:acetylglutamate kinase|nr:acetylglutamate kinase [Dysgonamonadaceae bacterium]
MNVLTIVKVGGQIVEEPEALGGLLKQFALIAGNKILVHGGGRSATEMAEKLGVVSEIVDGRRVTDAEMLKIVTMVYAGLVNKNIVASLQSMGVDAIGLTGADMNMMLSVRRPVGNVDYGFVGDVRTVNAQALIELLRSGYTPVLAPISHDGQGQLLNTNADTIAASVARVFAFDYRVRLVYCFEKSGVLLDENDDNSVISELNKETYLNYREEGIIKGGMVPKLDNAFLALSAGLEEVLITSASNMTNGRGTHIR